MRVSEHQEPELQTAAARPEADLLALVSGLVEELGHPAPGRISLDTRLDDDLGIDSLGRIELLLRLQQRFQVTLPDAVALDARTPRALLDAFTVQADRDRPAIERWPGLSGDADAATAAAPDAARTLVEVLEWHADRHGDRPHIRLLADGAARTITYRDLYERAQAVAAHLVEMGVGPGERVALMLPTSEAYFASFFGALCAGAVPVPIYPPFRQDAIDAHVIRQGGILENAEASVLITTGDVATAAAGLPGRVSSLRRIVTTEELAGPGRLPAPLAISGDAVGLVQYTSGSTGDPKGVVLAHRNLLANLRAIRDAMDVTARDVVVSWLPLYHDMGLVGAWLTSLYCGCPAVIMPPSAFMARPQRWLRAIDEYRGTISPAPNFAYALAARFDDSLSQTLDLRSWRLALNGAEPVSARTLTRFAERYAPCGFDPRGLRPVYGLAENAVALTMPTAARRPRIDRIDRGVLERQRKAFAVEAGHPDAVEMVSCGRAIPGHEVRIVNERGGVRANREVGLVQFRGPSACSGYWRNPEASRALFDGDWVNTGDYGYLAEGELHVSGRAKDVIIRSGRNLFPQELEEAAGHVPGVRSGSVAVFGQPDREGTDRLVIVAETRVVDPEAQDDLRRRIRDAAIRLVDVAPDEIVLVRPHSLPKTSSGKIQRSRCRELYRTTGLALTRRERVARAVRSMRDTRARAWAWTLEYGYAAWSLFLVFYPLKVVAFLAMGVVPSLTGRRRTFGWIGRAALAGMRIPVRVSGQDHLTTHRPCIAVVNHQGRLDTLVMSTVVPPHFFFAATRGIEEDPIGAWFVKRLGVQFVDRLKPRVGVADLAQVRARVDAGESAVVYPEGIFYQEPGLTRFYMGAFTVAAEAGVPVVPVAVRGARAVLRGEGAFFFRRGAIDVTILPPIVPDGRGWAAAVKLRHEARCAILAQCGEIDLAPIDQPEGPPNDQPGGPPNDRPEGPPINQPEGPVHGDG